ncbi:protein of unknown function [Taphrina deformans PYCC 5710]|uniref:Uncharacterized protein n=1 Tax=Taphrina deformans (strain PYCC 5710 / ATCC 11124 / CBS 356.35 / IMI 108563 / JCM 9778 / NBRC 8474) TaxID=1097556 RepID=R4X777_TAPDE|nr:protein of unknown function [Taphrina deformans PYCC 5710]|eukprot:CCG81136.1 protein of unknown function [Taphrina deformans PYCC 5710]
MKRQNSGKMKQDQASADQKTLRSYFRPRSTTEHPTHAPAATTSPRISVEVKDKTPNLEDSSDEDELVATDQILGLRGPSRKNVRVVNASTMHMATGPSVPVSPPGKAPIYTGSFSLQALLADRQSRAKEKETITRLEQSGSTSPIVQSDAEQDPGRKRAYPAAGMANDRVTELVGMNSHETPAFWQSVRHSNATASTMTADELGALYSSLPKHVQSMKDTLSEVEVVASWLQYQSSSSSAQDERYLCQALSDARDARTVMIVQDALMAYQPVSISSMVTLLSNLMGFSGDLNTALKDTNHIVVEQPPKACPLRSCKLSAALAIISGRMEGDRIQIQQGLVFLKLVILLALDCTYGHALFSTIRTTLDNIFNNLQGSEETLTLSLVEVTDRAEFQLQILQVLPVTPQVVLVTQRLAALYFLDLRASDLVRVDAWSDCLQLLIDHLQSSQPFHPLTLSTLYDDVARKTSLLAFATQTIPAQQSELTMTLVDRLQSLHGRIVDGKAAFIARSEAKGAIQRLADRLKYTLEGQKRKVNVFEHFK